MNAVSAHCQQDMSTIPILFVRITAPTYVLCEGLEEEEQCLHRAHALVSHLHTGHEVRTKVRRSACVPAVAAINITYYPC